MTAMLTHDCPESQEKSAVPFGAAVDRADPDADTKPQGPHPPWQVIDEAGYLRLVV